MDSILTALRELQWSDARPLLSAGMFAVFMAALAILIAGRMRLGNLTPELLNRCGFPAVVMCLLLMVLSAIGAVSEWSLHGEAVLAAGFGLSMLGLLGVMEYQVSTRNRVAGAVTRPVGTLRLVESENRAAA